MPYQYKREPLTQDEANRLANACHTVEEKLVVWTLLDTGLRVAELAKLTKANLDWQSHRIMVYGKGGPYGSKSKRRVLLLTDRIQPLLEGHVSLHDSLGMGPRTIQRLVKRVANRATLGLAAALSLCLTGRPVTVLWLSSTKSPCQWRAMTSGTPRTSRP